MSLCVDEAYRCRYWAFRGIRKSIGVWRSGIATYRVFADWRYVILYRSRPWRDGSCFSHLWILLGLLDPVFGPCLGLCNGMELRHPMDGCPAT